jgi:hypothetical protein
MHAMPHAFPRPMAAATSRAMRHPMSPAWRRAVSRAVSAFVRVPLVAIAGRTGHSPALRHGCAARRGRIRCIGGGNPVSHPMTLHPARPARVCSGVHCREAEAQGGSDRDSLHESHGVAPVVKWLHALAHASARPARAAAYWSARV